VPPIGLPPVSSTSAKRWTPPPRRSFSAAERDAFEKCSAGFGIELIDFERDGDALLVSSGCGIMVACMDEINRLGWCLDIDDVGCDARLWDFVSWCHYMLRMPILITGWFSLTSPDPLRSLVSAIRGNALAYTPGVDLGAFHAASLAEFIKTARG